MQFADDMPYPYKPNPAFKLWVPLAAPGCLLAFEPGRKPLLLFRQEADYWHLPPATPDAAWTREFDLRVVGSAEEARDAVPPGRRWALVGEPQAAWAGLGEANPPGLLSALDYLRAAKTPYEVECLALASAIGARAHRAAERAWRDGASEFDIHLAYCQTARVREEELPYNNIIALNGHGAVLHYQHLDRIPPAQRLSFLIDAGVPWAGYGCDITRTYAGGPGAYADLVQALDAAQQRLAALVVPGQDYRGDPPRGAPSRGRPARRGRPHPAAWPGRRRGRPDAHVLPARDRAPAGAAGARRRRPHGGCLGHAAAASGGPSLAAAHARSRAGLRGHHRAGRVLHRPAAGRGPRRPARPSDRLDAGRGTTPLRRHPDRGQRGRSNGADRAT